MPSYFEELMDDMGTLSTASKGCGSEVEFLQYVMQHSVSDNKMAEANVALLSPLSFILSLILH